MGVYVYKKRRKTVMYTLFPSPDLPHQQFPKVFLVYLFDFVQIFSVLDALYSWLFFYYLHSTTITFLRYTSNPATWIKTFAGSSLLRGYVTSYNTALFYIFIIISASFPRPFFIIVFKPFLIPGWTTHFCSLLTVGKEFFFTPQKFLWLV